MTKTKTKSNIKTKCPKDPTYAIFLKSRWFKDIKYDNMNANQTRPDRVKSRNASASKELCDYPFKTGNWRISKQILHSKTQSSCVKV